MCRKLILLLCVAGVLDSACGLLERGLTLNMISHGYLGKVFFCDFSAWGNLGRNKPTQVRRRTSAVQDGQEGILKPWLSYRHDPDSQSSSRSMQIEYNIKACQCDGETFQCVRDEMEAGSTLSICLWTVSDKVELVGVSEVILTHNDQRLMSVSNGVPNDLTTVEQVEGLIVVQTLLFQDVGRIPSNVLVDGTVYFVPRDSNDRDLLEPVDGNYFHLEIPLMRHIPSKKKLQEIVANLLRRRDFAISFGVLIFLWLALCTVACCRGSDDEKNDGDTVMESEEDSDASIDEEEGSEKRDEIITV